DRDDAENVSLLIEEEQLRCRLYDLRGRAHARHAGRLAVERRIFLDAFAIEVLHALPELRLVHRLVGRPLIEACVALGVDTRRAFTRIDLRLMAGPSARQLYEIPFFIGTRLALATATTSAPEPGEIRMPIGRARRRHILRLLLSGAGSAAALRRRRSAVLRVK